ncbi:hypothetical protein M2G42_19480 [Vibrio vulnificus]|nr:hypothetical protein [Vibrio vulnificus]
MPKGKLQRRKISPKKKAVVSSISPSGRYEIYLGSAEGKISCLELMGLHDGDRIVRCLNMFLRDKRSSSVKADSGNVLSYLRFVLQFSGVVNTASLAAYVDEVSEKSDLLYNTKYQKYATVKKFIKYLQESNVISKDMDIPEGFDCSKLVTTAKKSFPELARRYVENDANFDKEDIQRVVEALEINVRDAQAYSFALECMDILHREALSTIAEWEKDWEFVQKIIENLSAENIHFYKGVDGINNSAFFSERTNKEAIATLYAKFGCDIPAVKYWPAGMEDFFRSQGWSKVSTRVKLLFKGEPLVTEDAELLRFAKELSQDQLNELKELEDFSYFNPRFDLRTIEHAISILYVQYGRLVPDSTSWPRGVTDYLKHRGWSPNRVRAALFPTTKSVVPYIVGLLSYIDLSPNVDTVAQYAYLNSFTPSDEDGKVRVFLDKFRGEAVDKSFEADDPIIAACVRHTTRMKSVLLEVGDLGEEVLRKEKSQLFVQYTVSGANSSKINALKAPEASSVTNLVRSFINEKAGKYPILNEILSASGEHFRPTNALILKLSGEASGKIQKVLNHKSAVTTDLYTERVFTQTILKTKQKNFMQYLVDSAVSPKTKPQEHGVGIDSDLWNISTEGVDEWIHCEAQRFWFHDIDIISEWLAWETKISDAEEELKFNNPKRWALYWAPRLAKYKSMLALVSKTELNVAIKKAESVVLPPLS